MVYRVVSGGFVNVIWGNRLSAMLYLFPGSDCVIAQNTRHGDDLAPLEVEMH